MVSAAQDLNLALLPLPVEWWDFRFPPEIYDDFEPLYDRDLPEIMQLTPTSLTVDAPKPSAE